MKTASVRLSHAVTQHKVAALPLIAYLTAHHEEVWQAVRLIGGYEQCRLVDRLVQTLQTERRLTRRVRIMLDQLLDLLTLEPIAEDRCLFGAFVPLHPADPAVEEICLVTDGLRAALDQSEELGRANTARQARQAA